MVRPEFYSIKKPTGIAMGLGAVAAMTFGAYKVSCESHNLKCEFQNLKCESPKTSNVHL